MDIDMLHTQLNQRIAECEAIIEACKYPRTEQDRITYVHENVRLSVYQEVLALLDADSNSITNVDEAARMMFLQMDD